MEARVKLEMLQSHGQLSKPLNPHGLPLFWALNLFYSVQFFFFFNIQQQIKEPPNHPDNVCFSKIECLNEQLSDLHTVIHRWKPVVVTCGFTVWLQQKTHSCRAMNQRRGWSGNLSLYFPLRAAGGGMVSLSGSSIETSTPLHEFNCKRPPQLAPASGQ